jgi:hypothetical protein
MEGHHDIKDFYQVYKVVKNPASSPYETSYALVIADHTEHLSEDGAYSWIENSDERHTPFVILRIFKKS